MTDKAPAAFREGDWFCPCGSHNFRSRIHCNQCGQTQDPNAKAKAAFKAAKKAPGQGRDSRGSGRDRNRGTSPREAETLKIKKPKHLKRKLEQAEAAAAETGAEPSAAFASECAAPAPEAAELEGEGVAQARLDTLKTVAKELEALKAAKATAWKELCQKLVRRHGGTWDEGKFTELSKAGTSKKKFLLALGVDEDSPVGEFTGAAADGPDAGKDKGSKGKRAEDGGKKVKHAKADKPVKPKAPCSAKKGLSKHAKSSGGQKEKKEKEKEKKESKAKLARRATRAGLARKE